MNHPCQTPQGPPHKAGKYRHEGDMWACECGALYVLRNEWNYAGDWWVWNPLRVRVLIENGESE